MTKPRSVTRVNINLTEEAALELKRLAPSDHKRGEYLSALIMRQAAPPAPASIPAPAPPAPPASDPQEAAYAAIGRQVLALARELARSLPADLLDTEAPPAGEPESA